MKVGNYIGSSHVNNSFVYFSQQYLEQYRHELKLNEEFNNFVRNFQLAYWGPNDARHQINSKYKTGQSAINRLYTFFYVVPCIEYCDSVEQGGAEWLPLGPKHQQHTNHFSRYVFKEICSFLSSLFSRQHDKTTVLSVTKRIIDYLL